MTKTLSDDEVMSFLYKYAELVNEDSIKVDDNISILMYDLRVCIKPKNDIEMLFKKTLKLIKKTREHISQFYEWKIMMDFISEISPQTICKEVYVYFEGMPNTINSWISTIEWKIDKISCMIDSYCEKL